MTKDVLREICKKDKLYCTPKLNKVLYLHFKGIYRRILRESDTVLILNFFLHHADFFGSVVCFFFFSIARCRRKIRKRYITGFAVDFANFTVLTVVLAPYTRQGKRILKYLLEYSDNALLACALSSVRQCKTASAGDGRVNLFSGGTREGSKKYELRSAGVLAHISLNYSNTTKLM